MSGLLLVFKQAINTLIHTKTSDGKSGRGGTREDKRGEEMKGEEREERRVEARGSGGGEKGPATRNRGNRGETGKNEGVKGEVRP